MIAEAIAQTFTRRGTAMQRNPVALTPDFAADPDKRIQWSAFLNRTQPRDVPAELGEVIVDLAGFLVPITEALSDGNPFDGTWMPPGPWRY